MSTANQVPMRSVALAAVLCASTWILLADRSIASWVVGAPAVAAAVVSLWLLPPLPLARVRPGAMLRLLWFFLVGSLRGALQVALRSVARVPVTRSEVVQWRTPLRTPLARFAFANAISLMPGTLTARIDGSALDVHLFDADLPWRDDIAALEADIIATFEPSAERRR